jgi:two-component system alkaline phosphatase synthesis response regulator PhoP
MIERKRGLLGKRKILVADDEFYVRDIVKSALEEDYIVLEASDGEEAISIARNQKPSLILMDILLPKLDGISACCILKSDASTKAIPVVMISGRSDRLDQDYSREIGADGYLAKPFDIRELLDKINKY